MCRAVKIRTSLRDERLQDVATIAPLAGTSVRIRPATVVAVEAASHLARSTPGHLSKTGENQLE